MKHLGETPTMSTTTTVVLAPIQTLTLTPAPGKIPVRSETKVYPWFK